MNKALILLSLLAACEMLSGCSKKENNASTTSTATAAEPAKSAADPQAEAKKYFAMKCEVCHGKSGGGDGPGSGALNPKPAAFALDTWQSSVTDEHIAKIIVEGGAAVGKSVAMPPNPDLKGKDEKVQALVKLIRGFKK